MPLSLAVLVSGGGSNLQSIIDRIADRTLDAEIKLVLANKPDAYGLTRAEQHGIPQLALDHRNYPTREAFDRRMVEAIQEAGADSVAMAGFMRIVTPVFLQAFQGRVLNIHPALLPSFPGVHGQADANAYGVKLSGCTVHFADEHMDHGPVIIQAAVPAHAGEDAATLGKRILALEHRIYPQALQWFSEGRLQIQGRHVLLQPAERPLAMVDGQCLVNPPLEAGF